MCIIMYLHMYCVFVDYVSRSSWVSNDLEHSCLEQSRWDDSCLLPNVHVCSGMQTSVYILAGRSTGSSENI